MLKDITLGQFYPADSVIHRLDPRVKLFSTILYLVALFLINGVVGWILATVFLLAVIALSKVPFVMLCKGVRAIWALIAITAVCNLFFTQGEDVLFQWKIICITGTGIHRTIYYSLRLIYLVVGSSILTLTTSPTRLTDGMEEGLWFLAKIRIPIHEIAMMMSIALRFIPILGEEADKVKKAQMARGADFEEGNLLQRVKSLIPILVPLFVSAFRRANDLSLAMEARCYRGGEGRTKMHPLKYERRDCLAYIVAFAFLAAIVAVRVLYLTVWGKLGIL
ncbi:MAG: energy-coupling factor transporter transmembrane protein EcfT [Lachnospiraceae bacterium]|nr:energy-coupling factor transporter transmembrane protein EcfT [Lachnospiraceae bacterium]